jgi:DNA-binding NarL/FixJ family response regulator
MKIRVLLADDEPLIRDGIAMALSADDGIEVVGEASDGPESVDCARLLCPDVVLMDVRMPGSFDGIEATRLITADTFTGDADAQVKVVILTVLHEDERVCSALRAGASGFVLKHCTPEELTRAIRATAGGDAFLSPAVTRTLIGKLNFMSNPSVLTTAEFALLTRRELEVMKLVARGLSNAEIASRLFIHEATVKTHLSRILMKLSLRDRSQIIVAAYENGIVVPGEES